MNMQIQCTDTVMFTISLFIYIYVCVYDRLLEHGASRVVAIVTHGLFSRDAIEKINASQIHSIVVRRISYTSTLQNVDWNDQLFL